MSLVGYPLCSTEYENIFLTQNLGEWREMGDDLDISKYIKGRDDFIMWRLEERLGAQGEPTSEEDVQAELQGICK